MINRRDRGWVVVLLLAVPLLGVANDSDLGLVEAAKRNNFQVVRSLLEKEVDVNAATADGTTALHWAVLHDDIKMAELLLQSGSVPAPANEFGATPLWLACTNRSSDMVTLLLQAGADPDAALGTGETVLMNCSKTGAIKPVAALLSSGAKVNAAESSHGQTALMWAAAGGHSDVARLLIDHGADISAATTATDPVFSYHCRGPCEVKFPLGGFTPLLFAARSGDLETASMLLKAGADPNETVTEYGNSLAIASAGGHEELALYLLEMGANPDSTDETGITALHYAVGGGLSFLNGVIYDPVYRLQPKNSLKLARALLEAGANPDAQIAKEHLLGIDRRLRGNGYPFRMAGATPLILAMTSADLPMMNLLLEFGADPLIKTQDGDTLLIAAVYAAICPAACAYQAVANSINYRELESALAGVVASLELGIDVNAKGRRGLTAMHLAAWYGADFIVQYLADHGADVNIENGIGETPMSMASGISADLADQGLYSVHESTIALLMKLGATELTTDKIKGITTALRPTVLDPPK